MHYLWLNLYFCLRYSALSGGKILRVSAWGLARRRRER